MDKVGIPRSLFYYYYGDIWKSYLSSLKIPYIISPKTNKSIMERGIKRAGDEMCLSLKNYLGHIDYLLDKCDLILVPRISNYKTNNQTCTNFWASYDIVNNTFNKEILTYNIDLEKGDTLKKGLYKIGKELGKEKKEIKKAYKKAIYEHNLIKNKNIEITNNKLKSKKTKILIVSHPYNTYDTMIGQDIINYLEKENVEVIYSDKFDSYKTQKLSKKISKNLYFKYSKENIGTIIYAMDKIDGIIFISSFPCGPDSLVNELTIRKIKKPNINLILDTDMSFTGIETRLESLLDVIRGNINV